MPYKNFCRSEEIIISQKNLEKILNLLPEPNHVVYQIPGLDYDSLEKEVEGMFSNAQASTQQTYFKLKGVTKEEILDNYAREVEFAEKNKVYDNPDKKWLQEIEWEFETLKEQAKKGFEAYDGTKRYGIRLTPHKIEMWYHGKEPEEIANILKLASDSKSFIAMELKIN